MYKQFCVNNVNISSLAWLVIASARGVPYWGHKQSVQCLLDSSTLGSCARWARSRDQASSTEGGRVSLRGTGIIVVLGRSELRVLFSLGKLIAQRKWQCDYKSYVTRSLRLEASFALWEDYLLKPSTCPYATELKSPLRGGTGQYLG